MSKNNKKRNKISLAAANLPVNQEPSGLVEKKDKSLFVTQRPKISFSLAIKSREDFTEKQKTIIETALDKHTKCVFVDGLYGTSKSYMAVLASLRLLNEKKVDEIMTKINSNKSVISLFIFFVFNIF